MADNHTLVETIKQKVSQYGTLILLTKTGSHLYGMATSQSDLDLVGIYVANRKSLFGFNYQEQLDFSEVKKDSLGKNTSESIDIKIFELKKFLKLAIQNNPNIIELLFARTNEDAILYYTIHFLWLEKNAQKFINRKAFDSFFGYATAQMKKAKHKIHNFREIQSFYNDLMTFLQEDWSRKSMLMIEIKNHTHFKKYESMWKRDGLQLPYYHIPKNYKLEKAKDMLKERLDSTSYRLKNMNQDRKIELKFASHIFRLIEEGKQLILNKRIEFPLKNAKFLLDIRSGKYTDEELEQMIEKEIQSFKDLEQQVKSHLPEKPDLKTIENLSVKIYESLLCSE